MPVTSTRSVVVKYMPLQGGQDQVAADHMTTTKMTSRHCRKAVYNKFHYRWTADQVKLSRDHLQLTSIYRLHQSTVVVGRRNSSTASYTHHRAGDVHGRTKKMEEVYTCDFFRQHLVGDSRSAYVNSPVN